MTAVLGALAPVGLVIAIGWVLRRAGFPGAGFWAPAERLTYYVLLPALLVNNLGAAPLGALPVAPMAAALAAALVIGAGLMMALRPRLGVDGPAFSSLFQGAIRLNAYVGIAAAVALYGEAGLTLAAVALATFVPLVNVLSVAVLSRHGRKRFTGWLGVAASMVRNPLILACAAGAGINALGGIPPMLAPVLDILGRAALALGLLCVGAGLSFGAVREARRGIAITCAVKLVVVPLAAALACALLGVTGIAAGVVVLFAALPTATSAYILSRQMGGDAALMAQVVAATTAATALTLPLMLAILSYINA